jgi:hypothetical protein
METFQNYNGYGITYYSFRGITEVSIFGFVLKRFIGLGEIKGLEEAKKYIDNEILKTELYIDNGIQKA